MAALDRCNGCCITFDDPSDQISVSNKTEDVNVYTFNMLTRVNESKTLTKPILRGCKCIIYGRKFKFN